MTHRALVLFITGIFVSTAGASASAQTLADRIAEARARKQAEQRADAPQRSAARPARVELVDVTAREAFEWVTGVTGIPIIVHWQRLELEGISPEQKVDIVGAGLSAAQVLDMITQQIALDEPLIWEAQEGFVEVMTRQQANQRTVVFIYPIQDLLHATPSFNNAPSFDLQQISQQSNQLGGGGGGAGYGGGAGGAGGGFGGGGGGRGGGGSGLFNESNREDIELPTPEEEGEKIADLIRDTIEPELWRENGGLHGSIKYYKGNLIIRAPMHVHRQIGGPTSRVGTSKANRGASSSPQGPSGATPQQPGYRPVRPGAARPGYRTYTEGDGTSGIGRGLRYGKQSDAGITGQ